MGKPNKGKKLKPRVFLNLLNEVYGYWIEMLFRLRYPQDYGLAEYAPDVVDEILRVKELCEIALTKPEDDTLVAARLAYRAGQWHHQWPDPLTLGETVVSPKAQALGLNLQTFLERHHHGDGGQLSPTERAANEAARPQALPIRSVYLTAVGSLWIITKADRSATFILVPDEYPALLEKEGDQVRYSDSSASPS
jgi:hypothetical protein